VGKFGRVSSSQSRAIRVKDNKHHTTGFQGHTDMNNTYYGLGQGHTDMNNTYYGLGIISTYNWLIFLPDFLG
jgi:hypothetical protein